MFSIIFIKFLFLQILFYEFYYFLNSDNEGNRYFNVKRAKSVNDRNIRS